MGIRAAVILVAEDDTLIRILIVDTLIDAGYDVIQAVHAADAIVHLEQRGHEVRVLFTDVQMPGDMDGMGLAHHTRNCWPMIGVLVTSGQAVPQLHRLPSGSRFVPKPYGAAQVLAHVRELVTI
jgi:DNA-binding response OmpR family regulator